MKEKLSKQYGAIRLQQITDQIHSWKWANSRGYYRIIRSPYMSPGLINRIRIGEEIVWKSRDVTFDYEGGHWGHGSALYDAEERFKNTYFTS